MHEIDIWFLIVSLLFPRFTLFFWWVTNSLPYNTTPFIADVICSIFFPRVLVCIYIYGCQGTSEWFWIHLAGLIIAYWYHITHFEQNMKKFGEMQSKMGM